MTEEWRDILDFEGLYQVSNLGRVKSLWFTNNVYNKKYRKDRILKATTTHSNYVQVALRKSNKMYHRLVHRLVAQAFIENPSQLPQVNHKDGNKKNNVVDNLDWVSPRENQLHAVKIGLRASGGKCYNAKAVIQYDMQDNFIKEYSSISQASKETNSNAINILKCCKGQRNKCNNYKWKYKKGNK